MNNDNLENEKKGTMPKKSIFLGILSLVMILVMFSGMFMNNEGFLKSFDLMNLTGSWGKIKEGGNFMGSGGSGARDGFMVTIGMIPTICLAMFFLNLAERWGAYEVAGKIFKPLMKPLFGLPGEVAVPFSASFTSSDIAAVATKQMYENGLLSEKQRSIFVMYQYTSSAIVMNILYCMTAPMEISGIAFTTVFLVCFICKILAANFVRLVLTIKERKGA